MLLKELQNNGTPFTITDMYCGGGNCRMINFDQIVKIDFIKNEKLGFISRLLGADAGNLKIEYKEFYYDKTAKVKNIPIKPNEINAVLEFVSLVNKFITEKKDKDKKLQLAIQQSLENKNKNKDVKTEEIRIVIPNVNQSKIDKYDLCGICDVTISNDPDYEQDGLFIITSVEYEDKDIGIDYKDVKLCKLSQNTLKELRLYLTKELCETYVSYDCEFDVDSSELIIIVPVGIAKEIKPIKTQKDNVIKKLNEDIDLTFVDIETPNRSNDKICSIAIINYKNGKIDYKANLMVDPETRFDNINMEIHGITPQMVKDAPTLPAVWDKISKYFLNSIIVGHGISFDLSVLDKALSFYGLKLNSFSYIDTLNLAKNYIKTDSYKLSELCKKLNICHVQSHDALSDCYDCKNLLDYILQNNEINIMQETNEYYIQHRQSETKGYKIKHSKETNSYNKIQSLINKITEDNNISEDEINEFITLVEENNLTETYPISKAYQITKAKTGNVSEVMAEVKGDIKTDIFDKVFENKVFCLTGDFNHGSKEDVAKYIESKGGKIKDNLTLKVDYLIRGLQGSDVYAYGSYGGKIKRALEMKEKGSVIKIISENDIY